MVAKKSNVKNKTNKKVSNSTTTSPKTSTKQKHPSIPTQAMADYVDEIASTLHLSFPTYSGDYTYEAYKEFIDEYEAYYENEMNIRERLKEASRRKNS